MSELLIKENIQLQINRTLEWAVYTKLRDHGYTPDREQYLNNPTGYELKKTDIKNRKGFCVDLYGHGSSQDRKNKYVPRITITGLGFLQGSVGNDGQPYTKKNNFGKYDQVLAPFRSSLYRFEVELISNKSFQDIILETIRALALPNLVYIPVYQNEQDFILIQYNQVRNNPEYGHGLTQRIYTYEVVDVFETMPVTISRAIARIKSITVTDTEDNSIIVKVPK